MTDAVQYLDDLPEDGFRLTPGLAVSGVGHSALVVWILAGWGLNQEPLPFETMDVSVVSSAEFAALNNRGQPQVPDTIPVPLARPNQETVPDVTADDPVVIPRPEAPPAAPEAEIPPEALAPIPPPDAVADTVDIPAVPDIPQAPDLPVRSDTPQAEAAPRVAPRAAPAPPLNADTAPVIQQDATEAAEAPEVVEDPAEAAAPDEAATEIVTEAEIPSGAVEQALRPPARPARAIPQPAPEVAETPTAEPEATDSAVDDLLAELTETPAPADTVGDPGPPLTGGERDAFRVSVQGCWVVDPGSEAARVEVTVGFALDRDGKVVGNRVELLGSSAAGSPGLTPAFEAARRAILRCQGGGFDLPDEKYEQWRNVEMTFNPEQMRIR